MLEPLEHYSSLYDRRHADVVDLFDAVHPLGRQRKLAGERCRASAEARHAALHDHSLPELVTERKNP